MSQTRTNAEIDKSLEIFYENYQFVNEDEVLNHIRHYFDLMFLASDAMVDNLADQILWYCVAHNITPKEIMDKYEKSKYHHSKRG